MYAKPRGKTMATCEPDANKEVQEASTLPERAQIMSPEEAGLPPLGIEDALRDSLKRALGSNYNLWG
jgi:hypothetical protein